MRIYLDSNVFRDLKKAENADLLKVILDDKANNIYCYSEAHLLDLTRDKTNKKFEDMDFMEKIVDGNSWYYNKRIIFHHVAPKDFYDPFPESPDKLFDSEDLFQDNPLLSLALSFFKLIPLDFKAMLANAPQPVVIPEKFKELLEKPSNMYEFMMAFGDFTNDVSSEQKHFKELISYLHEQKVISKLYEQIGIKGYDGDKVTDRDAFRESYQAYFLKGKEKDKHDLFLEMYNGLELFGLVKGKPKKQKLMNMVNDGRHAFYGAYCDIVVSGDIDFIAKTNFMYDVHDILIPVFTLEEFKKVLEIFKKHSQLKFLELSKEISNVSNEMIIDRTEKSTTYRLNSTYFSYFDALTFVYSDAGNYCYFTSENTNLFSGALASEMEYVTGRLVSELGPDVNGKAAFDRSEIKTGDWEGRRWRLENILLELSIHDKLCLAFFPVEYLQKLMESNAKRDP